MTDIGERGTWYRALVLMCASALLLTACGAGGAPANSSATNSAGPSAASAAAKPASSSAAGASSVAAKPSQSAGAKPGGSGVVAASAGSASTETVPALPSPAAVSLDPAATAYLVLDITSSNCTQQSRPTCIASIPAISLLLRKARDAKAAVIYSLIAGSTILPEVAPQSGEPTVNASADKFDGTNLDDLLKARKATTLLIVGTSANGAVLYTSYAANARGYTVAVAQDGISTSAPFDNVAAQYLLLHEPGPSNAENKPLADKSVTLTRSDLVTFGGTTAGTSSGPSASSQPAASSAGVPVPTIPAAAPVSLDAKSTGLLVLDINTSFCQPNQACTATLPAIATLLKKARDAKATIIYSDVPNPNSNPIPDLAPQSGEPIVRSSANKFFNTNLADIIKQKQLTTLVMVGTFANGAVMYTAGPATARGYAVVVAEDGLSSAKALDTTLARYQLLRFPPNADNKPLAEKAVTLSRSDLISFK